MEKHGPPSMNGNSSDATTLNSQCGIVIHEGDSLFFRDLPFRLEWFAAPSVFATDAREKHLRSPIVYFFAHWYGATPIPQGAVFASNSKCGGCLDFECWGGF